MWFETALEFVWAATKTSLLQNFVLHETSNWVHLGVKPMFHIVEWDKYRETGELAVSVQGGLLISVADWLFVVHLSKDDEVVSWCFLPGPDSRVTLTSPLYINRSAWGRVIIALNLDNRVMPDQNRPDQARLLDKARQDSTKDEKITDSTSRLLTHTHPNAGLCSLYTNIIFAPCLSDRLSYSTQLKLLEWIRGNTFRS